MNTNKHVMPLEFLFIVAAKSVHFISLIKWQVAEERTNALCVWPAILVKLVAKNEMAFDHFCMKRAHDNRSVCKKM